jgi:hypothetical protein
MIPVSTALMSACPMVLAAFIARVMKDDPGPARQE